MNQINQALKNTFCQAIMWPIWLLVILIFCSALWVVAQTNHHRQQMALWQQQYRLSQHLHTEWTQLLLEESTWAAHSRIEQVAKDQFHMVVPKGQHWQVLAIPPAQAPEIQTATEQS